MIILQKLTPTQSTIIRSAAQHPEGRIALPDSLYGGARSATLKGLLMRGWIVEADASLHRQERQGLPLLHPAGIVALARGPVGLAPISHLELVANVVYNLVELIGFW